MLLNDTDQSRDRSAAFISRGAAVITRLADAIAP